MNAIEWLNARPTGFDALSHDERTRIAEFSVLWTYFEASVFARNTSNQKIIDLAAEMAANHQLDPQRIAPAANYFRTRYVNDGVLTHHYEHLRLSGKFEPRVRAMLLQKANAPAELLSASLLIVFRYRNNLFHGEKWAYGVQGQLHNFDTAIDLMQVVMDMRNPP
jgi:hypothetical protein